MCITANFIDSEWKLQKKIISFVPIYSHKGENIAKALESSLLDWGLKSVFSVTVDNAFSNDTALGFLKKKLVSCGCFTVRCMYLHMRCIAHILNLVIQDGLKECDSAVKKVRDAVRYVRSSPARVQKFRDLADLIGVEAKNSLCLDVPTRWNSTYMMLHTALLFQKVFEVYEDHDSSFKADLGENILDFMDWESIASLVKILKSFYEMTVRISSSLYVTANTFFSEVSDLSRLLKNMVEADGTVKLMGTNMREQSNKSAPSITSDSISVRRHQSLLKSQIKKQRLESGDLSRKKTELEVYLVEIIVDEEDSFDLLRWWKLNSDRFPVLSKMARDLLVVPISTVASESTFSTSGEVLDFCH
ncbi:zinc finger BED domain-containing protein RICESLEEPER 2-like [Ipomoea triloba]|uniref:zinc finger BED domain-containing protein RICESLEEPER 2-like n=1 Tax=Ipomoea triloba TaxID=35885 RepID=UPI00125DF859|nr:zinc finger BED domain-containing protein RICESLEEPER 2-like [Ipomoea triloba]